MSYWTTRDKQRGFHPAAKADFQKNFYKNVVPTDIDRFRQILHDRQLPKEAEKSEKTLFVNKSQNELKNSLNIRAKISEAQRHKTENNPDLNQYKIYALLAISARHR